MTNSPIDRRRLCRAKRNGTPTASSGRTNDPMSTLKPSAEMSHAVTVVPMLAPMMTLIDWLRVSSPALTKLTTMTVVADDDWTRAVMSTPVSTPATRLRVMTVKAWRIRSPANF